SVSLLHLSVGYDYLSKPSSQAKEIYSQLKALNLPSDAKVVITGHSQGAYVGYLMAQQGKLTNGEHTLLGINPPKVPAGPATPVLHAITAGMDMILPDSWGVSRALMPQVGREIMANQGPIFKKEQPQGYKFDLVETKVHDFFGGLSSSKPEF